MNPVQTFTSSYGKHDITTNHDDGGRMLRLLAALLLSLLPLAIWVAPAASENSVESSSRPELVVGLGSWHHKITTGEPLAQLYFDQGLRFVYAFNHAEAVRSFEEAVRLDPAAPMPYWGIALALGPTINTLMSADDERRAYDAIQRAHSLTPRATLEEQAYINALGVRYSAEHKDDRKMLDQVYADAMRGVWHRYENDADAATFFAEAAMLLQPWNLWSADGKPKSGTVEIVTVLEHALAEHPEHVGACHFYIHAVEASSDPGRALPCAERLHELAPGAGHLVHMPSHVYIRLGMYEKIVEGNERAISIDEQYLQGRHIGGPYPAIYYPHNVHFLWAGLVHQGRSAAAMQAVQKLAGLVTWDTYWQDPVMEFFSPTALFTLARFGQWERLLHEPAPPAEFVYSRAMWHYARGLSFVAAGDANAARAENERLESLSEAMPLDRVVGNSFAKDLLDIAAAVLTGQRLAAQGQYEDAIYNLVKAVRLQDSLRYSEPPDWYYPVRESLGRVLLAAGRPADAESVFRDDLKQTPLNPWSLHGLAESLAAQNKQAEQAPIQEEFRTSWSNADMSFQIDQFEAFLARSKSK
jgi:tetratricopeptide (TPR) repeat protein